MSSTERKMAAIVAMDVTSYSEKMGRDEEGTLMHLRACREIIETVVAENRGRIFNTAGDAFMIEFSSAVSALSAAVEIQKLIKNRNESLEEIERMYFRMGVNVGDIIIEGDNLYGEGVNIAARLEGISAPGGISISEKVYAEVRKKFNFVFEDKGHQELKNIDDPVRVYELNTEAVSMSSAVTAGDRKKTAAKNSRNMIIVGFSVLVVALAGYIFFMKKDGSGSNNPIKVSNTIVVLPIANTSKDELALNFSNGLTIELTNALSAASKGLNVIRLPVRSNDLGSTAAQAGAQYIIDGNLAVAGDKFRLSMSLINTTNNATIWNKTYEKSMIASEIFKTQDEIISGIIQEVLGTGVGGNSVIGDDIANNKANYSTDKLTSFECVNIARAWKFEIDIYNKSRKCLDIAISSDPNYADAWAAYAQLLSYAYAFYFTTDPKDLEAGINYANKAISLRVNAGNYYITKAGLLFLKKNFVEMNTAIDKAVELSPNNTSVLGQGGYLKIWGGNCTIDQLRDKNGTYESGDCQWQKGYKLSLKALELDKANATSEKLYGLTSLYFAWGDYKKALQTIQLVPNPNFIWYHWWLGIIYDAMGDEESASKSFEVSKKLLGGNDLKLVTTQFLMWNLNGSYESLFNPVFVKYGFK
jgi:class 3 adenylate cyclase/TolB-like protein/Tfp pilus assembly protein PilF